MTKQEKAIIDAALALIDADYRRFGIEPVRRAHDLLSSGLREQARLLRACLRYQKALKK